jgi:hypothetical protein
LEVGSIAATLKGLNLPVGLRIDEMHIEAEGLQLQTDPFAASLTTPGTFEVFVGDTSLANFVARKTPPNLRILSVNGKGGQLLVNAAVTMILELPASAVCTLRLVDKRFLYVDLVSVNVMGAGATGLVQAQLEKINPVLDANDFPVRATLEAVEIVDGGVKLSGTVAPPA